MKQSLIFLCCIVLFCSCSVAQKGMYSTKSKKAIKAYESAKTCFNNIDPVTGKPGLECAESYILKALSKDSLFTEAYALASNICVEKGDIEKAIQYKEKMMKYCKGIPEYEYFYLASMQMAVGNYMDCRFNAQKYIQYPDISEHSYNTCLRFIKNCDFALQSMQSPYPFEPVNLGPGVNTDRPEYFPSITADDSVLLFTRRILDEDAPWGTEQEEIFISNKMSNHWSTGSLISNNINTSYNEGAPTFSADGKYVIFVGCETGSRGDYEYGGDRKGYGSCDLFVSEKIGDTWSKPFNMGPPINSKHWETQPSFSSDGKTLYFIRGMTYDRQRREKRDQDIYMVQLTDEGVWTKPVRLGDNINTPYREESVQIHPDGQTLYFSSNGHTGMGGLDIYMSRMQENGEWGKAINLGYPINTHMDENSVLVSSKGELAFFATNREGGYGSLDLYSFIVPEDFQPIKTTFIKGKVYDKETNEPLAAKFELKDLSNGKIFKQAFANSGNGEFLVALPENKDFALHAKHEGYLFYSMNYSIDKLSKSEDGFVINVPMSKIQPGTFILENIFFDVDSWKLKNESMAELKEILTFLINNPNLNVEISGHTDSDGDEDDNQALSENRAKAVVIWLIDKGILPDRITSKGYGETIPLLPNSSDENKAKNRRTELTIQ